MSARTIVIDENGNELAESVMGYPHGVMETRLPKGAQLGMDWALQHPGDYLLCLEHTVSDAVKKAGLQGEDIAGIGIDFTSCLEDIYRALIKSTAYGTRNIIESFTSIGIPVDELYAGGGIARKDLMAMQIYADICNRKITIVDSNQSGALGAAILGLTTFGQQDDIYTIIRKVGQVGETRYTPLLEHVAS